jgi:hypothetical protein
MAQYPEVEVLTRKAQKRGGKNVGRAMKAAFLVQITVRTQMPCGTKLESTDRVPQNEADAKIRSMKTALKSQGAIHKDRCKKCKERP